MMTLGTAYQFAHLVRRWRGMITPSMTADRTHEEPTGSRPGAAASRRAIWTVARRPRLWVEGLRAAGATAPRRWWRTPPFLPTPDPRYMDWRVTTAYGSPDAEVAQDDVAAFLRWRGRMRRG